MGRICIVSMIKSQYRQLREWIDFNRLVGVDHFFLMQDAGTPMAYDLVLRLLTDDINAGLVTLYDARQLFPDMTLLGAKMRQRPFYDFILRKLQTSPNQDGYEWLICTDVDDFYIPVQHGTLPRFLANFNSEEIVGIQLGATYFGCGNKEDIPLFTPESLIETCQCPLQNDHELRSISSIKNTAALHAHAPMGSKPFVNAAGKPTSHINPVPAYDVAFYAYYIQPSLERLDQMYKHAALLKGIVTEYQRSRSDIALNRYTNNEWIAHPYKTKFDPNVKSTVVLDLRDKLRKGEFNDR